MRSAIVSGGQPHHEERFPYSSVALISVLRDSSPDPAKSRLQITFGWMGRCVVGYSGHFEDGHLVAQQKFLW